MSVKVQNDAPMPKLAMMPGPIVIAIA
jgi:hypothetical protein